MAVLQLKNVKVSVRYIGCAIKRHLVLLIAIREMSNIGYFGVRERGQARDTVETEQE